MHSIYDYFFTRDKLMVTYKNLTPSLHFLPLFNCSQLLFAMWLRKYMLTIRWYTKKIQLNFFFTCLNIAKVGILFQNTWTKGYHISMSMVIVRYLLMYQKITIHYIHTFVSTTFYISPFVFHTWQMVGCISKIEI